MSIAEAVILAFFAGYFIGAWMYKNPPVIRNVVTFDEALLEDLNDQVIHAWAAKRNLVWQPKGVEDAKHAKHK